MRKCPEVRTFKCQACGLLYTPDEIQMPGPCPECQAKGKYIRQRCDGCRLSKLDEAMAGDRGRLLQQVIEVDFMLDSGFLLSLSDVTAEQFEGLRVLRSERNRQQKQEIDRMKSEQASQAAQGGFTRRGF